MKIRAIVQKVEAYGEGVFLVVLKPEAQVPRFKAGQFLHLALDDYDPAGGFWPESRVFSIASMPGIETLTIVYSVKGAYTARMASQLSTWVPVWLKLPYGHFIIDALAGTNRDLVLIAGGTGISPFVPFLQLVHQGVSKRTIKLYYGVRTEHHLLFRELLEECSSLGSRCGVNVFIENGGPEGLSIRNCTVRTGRLSAECIRQETEEMTAPSYFLSGPPAMIDSFRKRLSELKVGSADINADEWE